MITLIAPLCALCGRPVDFLDATPDPMSGDLVITARCHGASEEVRVPYRAMLGAEEFRAGVAFATARPALP